MHAAACWEVLNQKTRDVNSCHSPNPSHLEKWVVGDRRGWTVFGMIQVKVLSFLARKILDHRNFSTLQNFKLIPAPLCRRSLILNHSSTDLDAFNLYSYHFLSTSTWNFMFSTRLPLASLGICRDSPALGDLNDKAWRAGALAELVGLNLHNPLIVDSTDMWRWTG